MSSVWSSEYERKQHLRTEASRQRILDAAVECLVEHGYHAASALRIQQTAGISRGRLLHHFPSRDSLLVAAVSHLATQQMNRLENEHPAITAGPRSRARIDQAVDAMWSTFHQPYFWASMQIWMASLHNEDLRVAVAEAEQSLARPINAALTAMFGPHFSSHRNFSPMAGQLVSSMRGVALTYTWASSDPTRDSHLTQWRTLARRMLADD